MAEHIWRRFELGEPIDYGVTLYDHPMLVMWLFDRFRWYRRWLGGHWELWIVDFPVASRHWFHVRRCSHKTGKRPAGLLVGRPVCEEHPVRLERTY